MSARMWAAAIAGGLMLAACEVRETRNEENATAPAAGEAAGVVREEPTPTPSPTPAAAPTEAAIRTHAGPDGTSVDLVRANVVGDILTVALTYRKADNHCCEYIMLDEVSVIDDATSQRIGVLKDNSGKWMAAPLHGTGDRLRVHVEDGAAQIWFKFPAPSAEARTVSINIPNVLPFDAVPLTR